MAVLSSTVRGRKRVRFFMPSWVERQSIVLKVNDQPQKIAFDGEFAEVSAALSRGATVDLAFRQSESKVGLVDAARSPGYQRFRRGPMLLGLVAPNAAMRPLFEVMDPLNGKAEKVQVLFAIPGAAPARSAAQTQVIDPIQASLASDVASSATASYRRSPEDSRAKGLFSALKVDATVLDAFVWEQPQAVSQVVLEWGNAAEVPKPADVVLKWLPAGAVAATNRPAADVSRGLREKKTPGVIGDGRRWIFTLSRELGAGAIDNIAILAVNGSAVHDAPERIFVLTR